MLCFDAGSVLLITEPITEYLYGDTSQYKQTCRYANLIDPTQLTDLIKDIYSYKHRLFYYGSDELEAVVPVIEKYHEVPAELLPYPEAVKFVEQPTNDNNVYFVER